MRSRRTTKMGRANQRKALPQVTSHVEEEFQRMHVAELARRLPQRLHWIADAIVDGDPVRAEEAFGRLVEVRERWLAAGRFGGAAVLESLMGEAFVAGCDATRQGVVVAHEPDWDAPGTGEAATSEPIPEDGTMMEFKRTWAGKIIKDGRRRRGAWVTKWRGWFNPRKELARDVADAAWVRLPRLVNEVEQRIGAYAICWLLRGEAWVLHVGWGRDVRQAAATKALELGYEVSERRVALAVHYMPDERHARMLAEDMAWLYAAPLNLRSIDG